MKNKFSKSVVSFLCVISLLFNSFVPFLSTQVVYATEDATPSAEATVSPTPIPTTEPSATPTPSVEPSPTISPTPIPTTEPSATPTPSPWTFEKVELDKEYVAPQNSGIKLTFTKLPTPSGNIKVKEITLTQEQIQQTGSLSDKAYDITSDMADRSFTYDLSLPIPESSKGKTVEVKFAEEISKIDSAEKVENTLTKTDTSVSVASLDHFTIFVVSGLTASATMILVDSLQPDYTAGDGVYSGYYGPSAGDLTAPYNPISPGSTDTYNGRQAGIIRAGFNTGPADDEGLFAVIPNVTINALAAGALTYDVQNQTGVNPVWMTIEIDTGVVDTRADNTVYQFVPTPNPAGWNTFNAGAGQWKQWTTYTSGITVGDPTTLSAIATANTGRNVVRTYLRLGMGDSYYNGGTGTTAWVDQATIGGVTYDFVVAGATPTSCTGASVDLPSGTTACYSTIQAAVNAATSGATILVAAGDYTQNLTIDKSLTLIGVDDTTHIIGNINSTGANVTIQNLKVTNSYSDDHGVSNFGVKATAGKALTLENVTIDVLYYGMLMMGGSSASGTAITLNNSRIKGYAAIYLNGAGATDAVVSVFNTSLLGRIKSSGSSDDFAVIPVMNTSGIHINFTGTSSVANEFTGGAQAKEHLIFFNNANTVVVAGTPTYTNAANSTVSAGAEFWSSSAPYTNTVEGQVVARYVYNTSTFEAALADNSVTTPILVGRYETAINTTAGTKTLNAGTTLIIEDNTPTTISAETTLVNNGTIIIETGATFINNGIIRGSGTISGTVGGSGPIDLVAPTVALSYNTNPAKAGTETITATYSEPIVGTPTISINQQGTTDIATQAMSGGATVWTYDYAVNTANGGTYIDGTATVSLSSVNDAVGNAAGAPTGTTFVIDTTAPTGLGTPVSDQTSPTSQSILGWSWTASTDALSGIGSYIWNLLNSSLTIVQSNTETSSTLSVSTNITALPDDIYIFQVKAGDTLNNFTGFISSNPLTVDRAAPIITISNPNTSPAQSKTVTAGVNEGTLSMSNTTGVTCDGSLSFVAYSSQTFSLEANNGQKVCYRAVDAAFNVSYSMSNAIGGIDKTPPITSITTATDGNSQSVSSGGLTKSNSISIAFNATDANGVAGSECDIDAGGYSACTSPKSYTGLSDGSHTVSIRSTDSVGNLESTATFTWTVDTAAPNSATLSINSGATYTNNATVNLTISAIDATSNVSEMNIYNGSAFSAANWEAYSTSKSWTIPAGDSSHTVRIRFRDAAGNENPTYAAEDSIILDATPPVITYASRTAPNSSGWNNGNVIVTWNCSDSGSDAVNASVSQTVTSEGTNQSSTGTCTDNAGNTASDTQTGINIDKTAPTAAITYSINHAVKSGDSLTITATFNEPVVDSFTPKIAISGSNTLSATDMVKTDTTHYTYTHTVGAGNGSATVALSVGQDIAGNVVTSVPTSGATFTVDNTAPTVTTLGDGLTDYELSSTCPSVACDRGDIYDAQLNFNEILSSSAKTAVENALTAGASVAPRTFVWNSNKLRIYATEATTFANDVVVNISDVAGNITNSALLVDSHLEDTQSSPDPDTGDATVDNTHNEVVITNPDQPVDITIDSGTTNPTIDVSSFVDNGTGDIPQITITSTAGSGNAAAATIEIPATTVTGPADWDGVIAAPTVTTVTLPSGSTLGEAIEIGFADAKLSFDNGVRILLPNQAGKKVGYSRPGTAFTEITNTCAADNQATGDLLAADSECKIDVGLDMVIWTKHFTKFASYTQTTSSGNSGSGGGGDGLSDGLGCANHDCSVHTVATFTTAATVAAPQNRALASTFNFAEEVLGASTDETNTLESTPSAVLGVDQTPAPSVIPNPAPAGSLIKPLAIGAIIVGFFIFILKFFIFK